MKKKLLQKQRGILVALLSLVCAISIQAQTTWTAPALTGSTLTTGLTYYVYNVGSNGYLTRGAWHTTQANISAQPRLNASTSVIKWTATNTGGTVWTFQYNLDGANVSNWYLFSADANPNDGGVFTDGAGNNTWNVVETDGTYSLQVPNTYGGYVSGKYLGSAATTEDTNGGIANNVRYNRAGGDSYTQWKFVSQADLDLYNARILLDKYMTYAKNKTIDISTYITTYNGGVTVDINTAAGNLLTALVRTTITVPNFSFESNDFTSWTNNSFELLSTDPGQGWTKDGTYYVQKFTTKSYWNGWTDWALNLAAGTLTQTVSGLSSGLYELVVSGHAVQQNGGNPLHTGAFITAGSQSTEVAAGQDYSISNILVTGSTLTIGYALSGTIACNWTGFDNFRLYYYGAANAPATQEELVALQVQIDAATALLASTPAGTAPGQYTPANRTVLSDAIASATTVHGNAFKAYVNSATSSLAAAITTYSNSINIATNQLANGDYYIKIGGMYVTDPGISSIADGITPRIANNGLQSLINIVDNSQIYTIAKVSGSDRTTPISRYSFFNKATSRNLNESAYYKTGWGGTGDDPWRTQNIYYNGTNYAIQSGGNAANNGMWYLKTVNELATNGINRTPIVADYVFELVPVVVPLWNGDGNWGTSTNWTGSTVPSVSSDVCVASGTLTIDQGVNVRNLTINPGAKVTLSSATLIVTGNLAIKSDATGTGTFVDNGTTTVTGTSTVQQYLTSGRNWYVSSPVTAATTAALSTATSVLSYDEVNGTSAPWVTESGSLTPMKGYISTAPTTNAAITFSGILNNGSQSIALTRTAGQTKEGFNLVGNPYPSNLTWTEATASAANTLSTIWYRTYASGAHAFYTYNATGLGVGSPAEVTGVIPPMQAFWVRANAVGGTLSLDNTMRSHSATSNLLKAPSATKVAQQLLRLQVSNGTNSDEAVVYFNANASDGYDAYDSPKMMNANASIPEIYTIAGTEQLVINGLNRVMPNEELPLGFTTGQSNTFTIKATEISNFDADTKVILKDNLKDTELDITDGTAYTFTSDVATTVSRFSVIFKSTSAITGLESNNLPVNIFRNANGLITINRNATIGQEGMVTVCNAVGQKLVNTPTTGSSTVINKSLTSGVYFVTLNVAGNKTTKRVIIN